MLDYKYIEQLIEKYFECQTTLEEENILRDFFAQEDVPVSMMQYKSLFAYEQIEPKVDTLDETFDERIMAMIDDVKPVKARTISLTDRLRPLLKAAAVVAMFITMGTAVEKSLEVQNPYPTTEQAFAPKLKDQGSVAVNDSLKSSTESTLEQTSTNTMVK